MDRISAARKFFEGVRLIETVRNTYRPELDGTRRRIDRLGASYFDATLLDPVGDRPPGQSCRGTIPTRARDVVAVCDELITFRLGESAPREGHTVTFRRLDPSNYVCVSSGEREELVDVERAVHVVALALAGPGDDEPGAADVEVARALIDLLREDEGGRGVGIERTDGTWVRARHP